MYIKIFFSFLLSGIMIQFFKIYNVIRNLNLLQNFKKYFFIIFNQMYFQKSNFKYIQPAEYLKSAHSTKTIRFFPEFDKNLKLYSKLIIFYILSNSVILLVNLCLIFQLILICLLTILFSFFGRFS